MGFFELLQLEKSRIKNYPLPEFPGLLKKTDLTYGEYRIL